MRKSDLTFLLLLTLMGCQEGSKNNGNSLADIKDTKVLQYAIEGKSLYETHCANCHSKDGSGLAELIPPLNPSDYMSANLERAVKIIKFGMEGEIIVNGVVYNRPMPSNPQLTDLEIAQISSYIFNIWGNEKGVIDAKQVKKILQH